MLEKLCEGVCFFVKLQARNLKHNLIMVSFRGISQRNFLDLKWFFLTDSFESQEHCFPRTPFNGWLCMVK